MYARPSRKKELARRTLVYLLMTVAVVVLLVILMSRVLGYQFNFETRSVQQAGLIQYDSFPRGARVSVDGTLGDRTQTKSTVLPGQRQFAMHLDGFETWQKTLDILPGTVTWLSYVRLVPTEKKIQDTELEHTLSSVLASPDRRFMAAVSQGDQTSPELVLMDFRSSSQPSIGIFAIDVDELSAYQSDSMAKSHQLTIDRWSDSSREIVIKHRYTLSDNSKHTEWLWVDRERPGRVVNLSKLLGLTLSDVQPIAGGDVYILQADGDVRRADVDSGSISRPLLSRVLSFDTYGENILSYVGWEDKERVAGVWQRDWQAPTVLARLPESSAESQKLKITVSEYFNKDTTVISSGSTVTTYRGALPSSDEALAAFLQTAETFTLNRPIDSLQISPNGRFIVAEDKIGFISYDLERRETSQGVKKYTPASLRWLDSYHVWQIDAAGQLTMQEFDGVNSYGLMSVAPGYDALLTTDGRFVYGFTKNGDTVTLNRLSMTI